MHAPVSFVDLLRQRAVDRSEAPALVSLWGGNQSYGQLVAWVDRIGRDLRALGISAEDRVAAVCPPGHQIYSLQGEGLNGEAIRLRSVPAITERYARDLIRETGLTQCHVAGYCVGGFLAIQLAHELSQRSVKVEKLVLADTSHPRERNRYLARYWPKRRAVILIGEDRKHSG